MMMVMMVVMMMMMMMMVHVEHHQAQFMCISLKVYREPNTIHADILRSCVWSIKVTLHSCCLHVATNLCVVLSVTLLPLVNQHGNEKWNLFIQDVHISY